jgi:hypothetical protein
MDEMTLGNSCASGIYPLGTKDNPNNLTDAAPLMVEQFAPRIEITKVDNAIWAFCHLCDQKTLVKSVAPRKGFFVAHNASVQGSAPGFSTGQTHGNKGKPARVRGREVYVTGKGL